MISHNPSRLWINERRNVAPAVSIRPRWPLLLTAPLASNSAMDVATLSSLVLALREIHRIIQTIGLVRVGYLQIQRRCTVLAFTHASGSLNLLLILVQTLAKDIFFWLETVGHKTVITGLPIAHLVTLSLL